MAAAEKGLENLEIDLRVKRSRVLTLILSDLLDSYGLRVLA